MNAEMEMPPFICGQCDRIIKIARGLRVDRHTFPCRQIAAPGHVGGRDFFPIESCFIERFSTETVGQFEFLNGSCDVDRRICDVADAPIETRFNEIEIVLPV
jgi:hypothetical protein